jgi:hypothetical protein
VTTNYAPMQLFQCYCQKPAIVHSTQQKYQNSAQIQYVLNIFPLLNAQSIPLSITLLSSLPKAVPSLKHTLFSIQMCMHCLLTFTTVFPAAWCALVFLNSSPLWTVSFYHVYTWASMFLICSKNNFILPWLLACTLFLICSSLPTASFYHVYQETMVFLISFPLPVISFCHDYQQASMFLIFFFNEWLQFVVFTGRPQQCGTWECSQISFQFWKSYFLVTVDLCAC